MLELKGHQQQETEGKLQFHSRLTLMQCTFVSLKVSTLKVRVQGIYCTEDSKAAESGLRFTFGDLGGCRGSSMVHTKQGQYLAVYYNSALHLSLFYRCRLRLRDVKWLVEGHTANKGHKGAQVSSEELFSRHSSFLYNVKGSLEAKTQLPLLQIILPSKSSVAIKKYSYQLLVT